jgi:membrane fusion protein (multidrug efflux system)
MRLMKKWFTKKRLIISGIIVVIAFVGWRWFAGQNQGPEYSLVSPERKQLTDLLSVSGQVDAKKKAVLRFPAPGRVAYVGFSDGETVAQGKLIMSIDTGNLQSAVTESYYRYLAADANAHEVEDSVKNHASDETFAQKNDRVTAQTARDIAYDNWLEAKRNLRDAYLYAPFAGVISSMTANSVGASVSVTDGVTVVDPQSLYFTIEIDENDLGKIQPGQKVMVDLDAFDEDFEGEISTIGFETILSDSGATVLPVKVTVPVTWASRLRLGLNGDADIVLQVVDDALVLPIDAVKGNEVILENGEKRQVEVGIVTDTEIQIKSGLSQDEKVRLEL